MTVKYASKVLQVYRRLTGFLYIADFIENG